MEIESVVVKSEQPDEDYCNIIEAECQVKEEDFESTNETPYKCGICGHRTTTDTLLKVHMKMHLVKRVHHCNICNKAFSYVTELNSHVLTHTEEKSSFQCEVCERDCFTEEDLHKHYRVHTKEKPFQCKLCSRSFSDDSYLRIHERSHHGEDYLKTAMKKNGTYVDPTLIQNVAEDSKVPKVSVRRPVVVPKRRLKNDPNVPLNNEEKRMLLRFVAELEIHKNYFKLDQIKNCIKNSWTKMVQMFGERDYDRNTEKLARTYFHCKNQAKSHLERFYKNKRLPQPNEIDYMFVKLCPSEFKIPGIDLQQVMQDSKMILEEASLEGAIGDSSSVVDDNVEDNDPLSVTRNHNGSNDGGSQSETSISSFKKFLTDHEEPPNKKRKCEDEEGNSDIERLRLKFLFEEEKRRVNLYKLEMEQKEKLFELDKRHREEIYKKDLEIKNLELELLRHFECEVCKKCFCNEEFLKLHIENHLNQEVHHGIFGVEDPFSDNVEHCRTTVLVDDKDPYRFVCEYSDKNGKCARRFGEKEAYENHVKSHENSDGTNEAHTTTASDSSLVVIDESSKCKEVVRGKEKTVFRCKICAKHFPVPSKLRSHMRTHTGEKPFKCDICGRSFATAGSLKDHGYLHTDDRPFKCTICDKGFTKNSVLEDHIRSHTGERPFECNICKKRYRTVVILNQHLLAHAKEKPFKCDVCNKSFIYLCNLKYHMVTHTGSKPFSCKLCDKSFSLKGALKMHMMDHTGEKPHSCSFCEKQFTAVNSLKKHERIHTGEKPYLCTICNRGFTQSSSLSRHLDSHKGEKPYRCTVCQKGFTSASYLKIHLKMHQGEAPYQCKVCSEKFTVVKVYRAHLKQHGKDKGEVGPKPKARKTTGSTVECKTELKEDVEIKKERSD